MEQKEFVFRLTTDEANVVGQALGELPYKVAAPVLHKLQAQAAEQEQTKPDTRQYAGKLFFDADDQLHVGDTKVIAAVGDLNGAEVTLVVTVTKPKETE